jgi:dipeptidyl aminopeptidase/acylaminoacyl peptidase
MPKRPIEPQDLLRLVFVGDPQISPDGDRVLFSKKTITEKNKYLAHLCTVDTEGHVTQWTQGDKSCGSGRWSPDGTMIAFTSGREEPSDQIYLISSHGGEARKLTHFPEGSIGTLKWSPDGTKIALTFRETEPERTEKAKKEREEKGLSTPPWVVTDMWYRMDGDGYFGMARHKIYIVDVATGEHFMLYDRSALDEYNFDWNPNSQELVVVHSAQPRPLADLPNDQIYRVTMDGQAWQLEGLPKGSKGEIAWSPDGKTLAYAGNDDEHDPWGTRNTRLFVVNADGGKPRDLTGSTDYDMAVGTLSDSKEASFNATLFWAPDSTGVYVAIGWHGEVQLGFVDTKNGGVTLLTEGHHFVGAANISHDGRRFGAIYGKATRMPEVAVVESELGTGRMVARVLTNFNGLFHEQVKVSEPEEVWLDSTDDWKVQAWVIKPIDYMEPRRYPAVLEIHGGPHAQYGWVFFHEFQVLAAAGYVVVYSNPRGSKGYGEEHCTAIKGDWGNKDWEDIQTVTRWMQHQSYIHPGQMGVMGGSYGGYMTNWIIGHTDEFKAAITDRCVSNMVSMAGNSDFPFNKDDYFKGCPWGDIDDIRELWRMSPISRFKNVKTPTMIIHSEGDLRCNVEQAEEVFVALQMQGVESRFVRYPQSSSHGLSRSGPPDLRLHRLGEIVMWWDRHLKVPSEVREMVGVR